MKNISKAFLNAQKKIENALKDGKNPHFKSKYATLESVLDTIKPVANENNIAVIQTINRDALGDYIETMLVHTDSGESINAKHYLHLDRPSMQALGSAITYARRYSLVAMFGIGQEDDDANAAEASVSKKKVVSSNSNESNEIKNIDLVIKDREKCLKYIRLFVARAQNISAMDLVVKLKKEFNFEGSIDSLPLDVLEKIAKLLFLGYTTKPIYSDEI